MQYNRDKEFDAIRFEHRPQIRKQLLPKTSSIVNLLAMPRPLISIHCLEGTLQSSWLTHIQGPSNDYSRPPRKQHTCRGQVGILRSLLISHVYTEGRWCVRCTSLLVVRRSLNHKPRPPLSATPSLEIHPELENRRVAMRYLGETR